MAETKKITNEIINSYISYINKFDIRNENDIQSILSIVKNVTIDYDRNVELFKSIKQQCQSANLNDKKVLIQKANTLIELLKQEMEFIYIFAHKYGEYKMDIKPKVQIIMNRTAIQNSNAVHNAANNSVKYNIHDGVQESSSAVFATSFHELRHAVQNKYVFRQNGEINFDPLFILMAKEKVMTDEKIVDYHTNHHNMIFENDANLYATYMLKDLSNKYLDRMYDQRDFSKATASDEQNNFLFEIYSSGVLLDDGKEQVYKEKNNNNRLINTDKKVKEALKKNPSLLFKYPILNYVYDKSGNAKSYQQILLDRENLINKYKGNDTFINDAGSYSSYALSQKTQVEHIRNIYQLIISSDPVLWFEDCLSKKSFRRIEQMIEDNPLIINEYFKEIGSIIPKYNDGSNEILKIMQLLEMNNNYGKSNNQNTQSINKEETVEIPEKYESLFEQFAFDKYKESIEFDNLDDDLKQKIVDSISEGKHEIYNSMVLNLEKWYQEIKKDDPNIEYNDLFTYLYPDQDLKMENDIEKVERTGRGIK